jgi:4'-phosphopantetheinyl transferase
LAIGYLLLAITARREAPRCSVAKLGQMGSKFVGRTIFKLRFFPVSFAKFQPDSCRFLSIHREGSVLRAAIAFAFEYEFADLVERANDFLGPTESTYFGNLEFIRRRQSYLLGRYAAKLALARLWGERDLKSIEILRGVFDQPIVSHARSESLAVSMSHSATMATALAFPAGHPMGIDVELIDPKHGHTLRSQMSGEEVSWIEQAQHRELELATAMWTAKEALSKVLCAGLMSPVQIYNLSELHSIEDKTWEAFFCNFAQYKVIMWLENPFVLSIVLPKRSTLGEDWNQAVRTSIRAAHQRNRQPDGTSAETEAQGDAS